MQKQGYLIEKSRGITFVLPKNNIRIKGSDLGKEYSLSNLSKKMKGEFIPNFVKSSEIINLKRIIDTVLPKVENYQEFKNELQTQGYSVRFVEKDSKKDIKFEKEGLGCKFVLGSNLGEGYRMEDIQKRISEDSPMIKYDNNENVPLISDLLESSKANFQTEQDLVKIDQSLKYSKFRKEINTNKWGLKKKV